MHIAWKLLFLAALVGAAAARPRDDEDSREMDGDDRRSPFARRRGGFMRFRERRPEQDEIDRDDFKPRRNMDSDSEEEEKERPRDRENEDEKPMRRGPWFGRRRMMESGEGDEGRSMIRSRRPHFEHMFGFPSEMSPRFLRRKSFRRPEMDKDEDDEERRPYWRRFRPRFDSEEEEQQEDDSEGRNEMRESRDDEDSEGRWYPKHHRRHGRHGRRHRFPPCHRRSHHRRHRPWMSWTRDGDEDEEQMQKRMMMRMFFFHRMMQMRRQMEQNREESSNIYGSNFWQRPQFYPQQQSGDMQQTQYSRYPSPNMMYYLNRQGMSLNNNNNDNSDNNQDTTNYNSPLPPPPGINLSQQPQVSQTFFGSTQGRPILQINEVQPPQTDSTSVDQDQDMQNMVTNPLPNPPGIAISTTTQTTTTADTEEN